MDVFDVGLKATLETVQPVARTGNDAGKHLRAGNFPKAAEVAESVGQQLQDFPPAMLALIVAYAPAGQIENKELLAEVGES